MKINDFVKKKLHFWTDFNVFGIKFTKIVRHVKETILIRVIGINVGEQIRGRRQDVVHEDEDGFFGGPGTKVYECGQEKLIFQQFFIHSIDFGFEIVLIEILNFLQQMDTLADDVDELADCKILGYQIPEIS